MADRAELGDVLAAWSADDAPRARVAAVVVAMAEAGLRLRDRIAAGPLAGDGAAVVGSGADGDQKALDVLANELVLEAMRDAGVGVFGSEEMPEALALDGRSGLAVACDPLDGSSNIGTNVSIGTIFSVLPVTGGALDSLLQPGTTQLAAGYLIYGPQCQLVLTVGEGTDVYTLDPADRRFKRTALAARIPATTAEYAINSSNARHWSAQVRAYVDDCVAGQDGPRETDMNMRWVGSMVADCQRILTRGGVYLYPGDRRVGYQAGRLRLVYEGNPIAWLIEQAGGKATDGVGRILELIPTALHQRTPLMFGSAAEIDRFIGADPGQKAVDV